MKSAAFMLIAFGLLVGIARADDPCDGFAWNVKAERILFAREAQKLTAGTDIAAAPALDLNAPYAVGLSTQDKVRFALPPGRRTLPDGAHAGLAKLSFPHAGLYRVSLDTAAWVDVVVADKLVSSRAFQGQPGCGAPHKIVEYELPAGEALIQISAAQPDHLRLTITESPPPP